MATSTDGMSRAHSSPIGGRCRGGLPGDAGATCRRGRTVGADLMPRYCNAPTPGRPTRSGRALRSSSSLLDRGRSADRSPTTRTGHLLRGPGARRRDRDDHV